jgi:hypothetical protein
MLPIFDVKCLSYGKPPPSFVGLFTTGNTCENQKKERTLQTFYPKNGS